MRPARKAFFGLQAPVEGIQIFRISDAEWRRWINSPENAFELGEDPQEGLFVQEVPCYGGGYLAMPSDYPDDPFIVECFLEAALLALNLPRHLKNEIAELAVGGIERRSLLPSISIHCG